MSYLDTGRDDLSFSDVANRWEGSREGTGGSRLLLRVRRDDPDALMSYAQLIWSFSTEYEKFLSIRCLEIRRAVLRADLSITLNDAYNLYADSEWIG